MWICEVCEVWGYEVCGCNEKKDVQSKQAVVEGLSKGFDTREDKSI